MTATSARIPVLDATRSLSPADRVNHALLGAALLASALAFAAFAFVCVRRVGHPYELEWIEGGTLQHVERVTHGQSLYTRPTLEWTPNIYPPLYYWVSGAVTRVAGLSLTTLRAVSVVSSLALAAMVGLTVRRETRELIGPAVAIGLLFASYRIGGSWFDIARVDMLFLALLFAGLLLARITTRPAVAIVTAGIFLLAMLAKQAALVPALAVVPWMWQRGRACFVAYVGTLVAAGAAVLTGLQLWSHGWFLYYAWTVPSHHAIEQSAVFGFWTHDVFRNVGPALVLAALGLALLPRDQPRAIWLHAPFYAGLVLASYSARLHTGGWDNVLLPAYVGTALLAGVAVGRARTRLTAPAAAVVAALAVLQFALLGYQPTKLLPHAGSTAAGDGIVAQLRALPGPVLLTGEPWLLARADRSEDTTAQASALQDVFRAGAGEPARRLESDFDAALRAHRYCSVVVTDPAVFSALPPSFAANYRFDHMLEGAPTLEPPTGYAIGPASVWVPHGPPTCGRS